MISKKLIFKNNKIEDFDYSLMLVKNFSYGDPLIFTKDEKGKFLKLNKKSQISKKSKIFLNDNNYFGLIFCECEYFKVVRYLGIQGVLKIDLNLMHNQDLFFIKNISSDSDWILWARCFGINKFLKINSISGLFEADYLFYGPPNKFNCKLINSIDVNMPGSNYLMVNISNSEYFYCGIYEGVKSDNFVELSFNPELLIIKRIDNFGSWKVFSDFRNKQITFSLDSAGPIKENSNASVFLKENGFIIRNNLPSLNQQGGRYFYMAFRKSV